MLLESTVHQYVTVEYNNEHHNLQINGDISITKNEWVSTLTLPYVTSTNDEGFSLFSPIHDTIKYSDWSKSQSRSVRSASDVINSQIKSLSD